MKRILAFVLVCSLYGLVGGNALAQNRSSLEYQFRLNWAAGLGLGIEAPLRSNLVTQFYTDVNLRSSLVWAGGGLLFKPDLGELNRELRGIRPYFGPGLGMEFAGENSVDFGFSLSGGLEFELSRNSAVFLGGHSYFLPRSRDRSYLVFGASFR